MKKQKYSIEFSHIYADQELEDKQLASVAFLNDLIKAWELNYSTIILIDNYNSGRQTLNVDKLLSRLGKLGIKPDFYGFEADLVQYADEFMKSITVKRVKSRYQRYYQSKGKYPCSFLTAIWYSIRLGVFKPNGLIYATGKREFRPADRLVNILVDEFRGVERESLELLKATKQADVANYIQNLFYETPARVGKSKKLAKIKVF